MPDDTQSPESGAQPAEPAAAEETFTLTRAQLDELRQRTIDEHAKAAQPPAAPVDPLQRYYQGVASRAQQKAAQAPQAPQGESSLDRIAKLMELQIMQTMAPKPPPPPKPVSVEDKLRAPTMDTVLGKGPTGWTSADRAALTAKHKSELAKTGFKGDLEAEAEARARKEVVAAFTPLLGSIKVSP